MKGERKLSKKDLFYRCLKYGRWNFGYIPDNAVSRAHLRDALMKHGMIKSAGYENRDDDPVFVVEKSFTFEDDRHGRRCTIRFINGDTLITDKNGRFWL